MTNVELNTALYEKLFAEQEAYKKWLLTQPPEEILNHSYEFTVREDILLSLEYHDLTDAQASALLKCDSPLGDIFKDFEKRETGHMDTVFASMESRADAVLAQEAEKRRALRETPVYPYPADYAEEHGELEQYRASHKANIACKKAIESAVREHYHDNLLDEKGAQEVIEAFGMERTLYVLANTVREKDWDGRFSHANQSWARTVPVYADMDHWNENRNRDFVVSACHPCLTDCFVDQVRREQNLRTPISDEEIKREAARLLSELQAQGEPNSPNGTHFMAEVSEDFMERSSSRDMDRLMGMFPFRSAAFSGLQGRKGHYLLILKSEDRSQPLKRLRRSVRTQLGKGEKQPGTKKKKEKSQEKGR